MSLHVVITLWHLRYIFVSGSFSQELPLNNVDNVALINSIENSLCNYHIKAYIRLVELKKEKLVSLFQWRDCLFQERIIIVCVRRQ